jgi:pimeloyl-ACP methyl ester carboxylesterase
MAAALICCAGRYTQCFADDATPSSSHFAKLGTNKVHYITAGTGRETLVFVHGWSCSGDFWHEQLPALQDKARLICVDLPGHGQSDKPHTDYTMDYFADAVLAVMRDAHVKKATLIGHSMGAPVICRVYGKEPGRVAALVSVDGIMRRPAMSPEQAAQFISAYHTPEYRTQATNFIRSMFPSPGTEALRDRILAEMLLTPQYVMAGAMDGMFAANQPDWDLKKVNVPVIVINTENPMWDESYKKYIAGLSSKTDYRSIPGAGHFLMLEKPEEFNTLLLETLRKFDLVTK